MKPADLAKARAEVDPKVAGLRSLHWLSQHLYGLILLTEQLQEGADLAADNRKERQAVDTAQSQLSELRHLMAKAKDDEAEQAAQFDRQRKERQDALAELDRQARALAGAAARATALDAREAAVADQRKRLSEISSDLESREARVAEMHRQIMQMMKENESEQPTAA